MTFIILCLFLMIHYQKISCWQAYGVEDFLAYVIDPFNTTLETFNYRRFKRGAGGKARRWLTWKLDIHPDTVSSIFTLGTPRLRQYRFREKNVTDIGKICLDAWYIAEFVANTDYYEIYIDKDSFMQWIVMVLVNASCQLMANASFTLNLSVQNTLAIS